MWCSHRLKNSMSRDRKRAADGVTGVQTCALPIYARNLAQPDHLLLWQVGHVHLAVERQHVVLAQAEELDVPRSEESRRRSDWSSDVCSSDLCAESCSARSPSSVAGRPRASCRRTAACGARTG